MNFPALAAAFDTRHEPSEPALRQELWWMFLAAIALRIAVFLTMHKVYGFSVQDFAEWTDGKSYLWMAETFAGSPPKYLREYDHRVFPGFPALLAIVYALRLPLEWTGLAISWFCSGLCGVLGAKLFADRRMGWALATLTPQFVLNGSMVMTESLMLACTLGGLLLAHQNRAVLGGMIAGFGGLVRPMVCFSVLGQAVHDARAGRWRRCFTYGGSAAVTLVAGLALLQLRTGDALRGPRVYATHKWAYGGQMFDWPFHSMLLSARYDSIPVTQLAYFLLPVPIVLLACLRLYVLWRRDGGREDALLDLSAVWLWTNTLFALCVASSWALSQFGRFILVALPPLVWAYRPWLPRGRFGWAVCALISYGFAVITF